MVNPPNKIAIEVLTMILAIDQGTTGTTIRITNIKGVEVGASYNEFQQIYPQAGWVEHDPLEIWRITQQGILKLFKMLNSRQKIFPVLALLIKEKQP